VKTVLINRILLFVSQVCKAAGAKISYDCSKGECGTCEAFGDGKRIRICKSIVPYNAKTFTIKTIPR
jgi:aerobic-type carbon monoxide dehydrogenase small subunit (CoxS/CutS family)